MSRASRLAVIAAAWAVPVVWVSAVLFSGPSDGTTVSLATGTSGAVEVVRTYGETTLRPGDVVIEIDGRTPGAEAEERSVGDTVSYFVQRQRPDAALDLRIDVDVDLVAYPIGPALVENVGTTVAVGLLLLAGSIAWWRRPGDAAARGFLAAAALVPLGLTVEALGPGAIDLAGGRGLWPLVVGLMGYAVGLGVGVLAAAAFPSSTTTPRPPRWITGSLAVLPVLTAVVTVVVAQQSGLPPTLAPVTLVGLLLVIALLVRSLRAAADRTSTLAARLALIALAGGLGLRILLGLLPEQVSGEPLLPWTVLDLLVTPLALALLVVAVIGYRLDDIEPTVRRAVVQGVVAAAVATSFIVAAAAVGRATAVSTESLLAGGVIALLVVPLAVALQRTVRRLVYGDRDLPRRVVSELRRLDPTTAPEDALHESLALLARRLRLSYAAIEVEGQGPDESIATAVGQPRGTPVTVDLVVGGSSLGRLLLEVEESRDPFGTSDRRLLEDVGAQIGALVQAVTLSGELQRSRQRLVNAREEERRRLRRDLHDGLGPSLASLAMGLESAQDLIADDPDRAAELVGRLSDLARDEIAEVRRLVDGLRPPSLDQLGLVTALRQRADEDNLSARGSSRPRLTWTVVADEGVEPLPAAVEVAAYRIAMEAVTNAFRHSDASSCTVTLRRDDGELQVLVRDDGAGLAPRPRLGVGLSSMRERAEELGGSCTVVSGPGTGTIVEARLPIGGDES